MSADGYNYLVSLDDRSSRIRRESATPVAEQVAADLERDITSHAIPPDTRLPSEPELASQYGVARETARRAIALLRERGHVVTVHGRGSFTVPDR
jgi:DNA-binding GntR family transcriptional regulator